MGVDMLDITFRLEKAIGIKIPAEQFWDRAIEDFEVSPGRFKKDVRVKRVHELLCELTMTLPGSVFDPESRRQHVVESLHRCFGVRAELLTPETKLEDIVPKRNRRAEWERLAAEVGSPLPQLSLSGALSLVGLMSGFAAVCSFIASVGQLLGRNSNAAGKSLLLAMILAVPAALLFWQSMRTRFAYDCQTIDDLLRSIACLEAASITRQKASATETGTTEPSPNPWTADLLWQVMKVVFVDALGVDEEEVVPEALMIRDLGCD